MIFALIVCVFLILLLVPVAVLGVLYAIKFAKHILFLEDLIDGSLDALETAHQEVSYMLTIPVTMDDENTRSIIQSVKNARDAIKSVASNMSERATNGEES